MAAAHVAWVTRCSTIVCSTPTSQSATRSHSKRVCVAAAVVESSIASVREEPELLESVEAARSAVCRRERSFAPLPPHAPADSAAELSAPRSECPNGSSAGRLSCQLLVSSFLRLSPEEPRLRHSRP